MVGLFKQKTPVNILVLLVVGILLKLPAFKEPFVPRAGADDAILYRVIVDFLTPYAKSTPVLFPILAFLLLFMQAMQLNKLVNDQRMMQKNSYLPAASYLVISSLLPEWNHFSAPLLINTMVLIVFSGLFSLYHRERAKGTVFNIGLMIGIGSFFLFPSLVLFVWLIFGLMVMRPVRLNEWLICLVGVTAPYYFYAAYLFLNDQWSWGQFIQDINFQVPVLQQSFWMAGSSFLLVIPFLVGAYFVQENLRRMLIQVRKCWSLVLIYLLFAFLIPFLNGSPSSFESWMLIIIPFAAFHGCAYQYPRQRWFPGFIFWLSVVFVLAYQYKGPGW